MPITLTITYSGDAPPAEVRIIAEQYVSSLGIGGRFAVRDMYKQYANLELKTLEILSPARDVQADDLSIITATISITKETW